MKTSNSNGRAELVPATQNPHFIALAKARRINPEQLWKQLTEALPSAQSRDRYVVVCLETGESIKPAAFRDVLSIVTGTVSPAILERDVVQIVKYRQDFNELARAKRGAQTVSLTTMARLYVLVGEHTPDIICLAFDRTTAPANVPTQPAARLMAYINLAEQNVSAGLPPQGWDEAMEQISARNSRAKCWDCGEIRDDEPESYDGE